MPYGTESHHKETTHVHKMSIVEMIMLRWISGITKKDKI